MKARSPYLILGVLFCLGLVGLFYVQKRSREERVLRRELAGALEPHFEHALWEHRELPELLSLGDKGAFHPAYTLDEELQNYMSRQLHQYRPDYGAFVALDANSGAILSLVSYTRRPTRLGHLALNASFPAASVFKIVTVAAAMEHDRIAPMSVIPFNGKSHTLYRQNVFTSRLNRWTRYMTVKEAFARSVNTVFGKLGVFYLQPEEISDFAKRFFFNQAIPTDVPVAPGHFYLKEGDSFAVAEIASGFNRMSQISPLQGALIAAAMANDGSAMAPYLIDSLWNPEGEAVYRAIPSLARQVVTPDVAEAIRSMMVRTVDRGTSRSSFRTWRRPRGLEVGGKTGSLSGQIPRGRCDWFVGYGRLEGRKIAVAALTVNVEKWTVKSSYLARLALERVFRDSL